MKCEHCDEEHNELYLHARCHPSAPAWAVLYMHEGSALLRLECAECRAPLHTFKIDGAPPGL